MEDIAAKTRKPWGPRRLVPVDLDKIQRQLTNVLKREVGRLLDESFAEKLCEGSSKNLVIYLKLLKDLREEETKDLENLTDEELEKLANKENKT